jgi:8-oxo-dGTP pyrophosphatase MutT (NUDIX family)
MSSLKTKATARRVQYAALPFRRKAASRVQVMLVTSRDTGRWIIPKGWPIRRKAPHASAAREALEEAGVVGRVGKDPIGTYSYKKRLAGGTIVTCEVQVFLLEVRRQKKHWLEKEEREFHWFSPTRAANAVQEPALGDIIRSFSKTTRSSVVSSG